jgi:hypothetical protein
MNQLLFVFKHTLFFLLFILTCKDSIGQNTPLFKISGKVLEASNKMPMTHVTVRLASTNYYAITGLDGSFVIPRVPEGKYKIIVDFMGFKPLEKQLDLKSDMTINVEMEEVNRVLSGASVVGIKDYTSDESARVDEKKADNVLNIISARSIDLSPDLTVANITQRVSGVSLERNNNGDGQHAIVRGMDKRYNYTLVNGIKIPSSDPKNRYVPLDIFPSDLLDRLVVTKSLLPNMEGDAIGGVIDMKMKDAPAKFTLSLNLGTGFNTMYGIWPISEGLRPFATFDRSKTNLQSPHQSNPAGYRATLADFPYENMTFSEKNSPMNQVYSLSIGNRLLGGKLGVLVAGSYQNTYRGANSMFMSTFVDQESNNPYYEIMQLRKFSTQQVRTGIHTKLDYKITKRHKIDLYAAYVDLQEREVRSRVDTILKIGRGQGPGTGRVELRERSRQRFQKIYNTTLQGKHQFTERFKMDWSLVYSLATNDDPDMVELQWLTGVTRNSQTNELQNEPILYNRDFTRRWTNNTDNDLAGYYNATYTDKIGKVDYEISAGGMYRNKQRVNHFNSYLFRTAPITQVWSGDVRDYTFTLFNNIGTPTDPLNYECREDVLAAYSMFKLNYSKVQVMGGARYENTDFSWITNAPAQVLGKVGSINYSDILPSLHVKHMPNKKTNIRASYFASISRPSFFEVIPYDINEEDFRERGNPFLKRTQANNFDFRVEKFPTPVDQIMVGLFYKRIINPIESALLIQGQTVFLQPNNFGTATNMGIEIDYTKYFNKFGIRAFYTYTYSEITTTKIVRFRDDQGNLTSRNQDQTRPLQGQSAHISNIALLFKDSKRELDMQLAMVYTGDRIISVSPYLDNDIWQRGFVQLDFSMEKKFKKRYAVYLKVNNILNTPLLADIRLPNTFNPEQAPYLDSSKSVLVRSDFYWQTIVIGVKYKI